MKTNSTLSNQATISTEVQPGNINEQLSREQLVELVEAQLAAIGGGGDQPEI
jgi:hypothetical protein